MGLLGLFFSLRGRANRMQYWIGSILANIIASFVMQMSGAALLVSRPSDGAALPALGATFLIIVAVALANMWVSVALTVKRLHDRGRTGWIVLLSLVPALVLGWSIGMAIGSREGVASAGGMILPSLGMMVLVGIYFFIDLGLLPGVDGPNQHGDPPAGGFMPRREIGPINFDAPQRGPSSLGGAEAALERAIAERRAAKPSTFDPPAAPRPAPAAARPIVSQAPTFGRRGLT